MASSNRVENTHNEMLDLVSIQIWNELRDLPQVPHEKSIFKVHNQLRMVNEKAYEPGSVAIGPYHHDNPRLHYMEEQKSHYLRQMLRRRNETGVHRYVQALGKIEDEVRQQYAGNVNLETDQFIKMMLFDGCFIIEYFRKYNSMTPQDENDPLLGVDWTHYNIERDLLLLENQLPFIVLRTLYDLTKDDCCAHQQNNLLDVAWNFFTCLGGRPRRINRCKHLLDLVYEGIISNVPYREPCTDALLKKEIKFIRPATELKASGIKFRSKKNCHMLDIKFEKGTLEIPTITIEDDTEAFLRNLVAYEQHCQGAKFNYITDYVSFIDYLVNTPKDVELLCQKEVIHNYLGDDQVVSTMFNKMGDNVVIPSNSYYESTFIDVNEHCSKRWNHWMAILRRDYFQSPWALISVLAAIMLLLLTLIQTLYTVISAYQED